MVVSPAALAVTAVGTAAASMLIDAGTVATDGSEEDTVRNCGVEGADPNLPMIDWVSPLAMLSRAGPIVASSLRMVACPFTTRNASAEQHSRAPLIVNCLSTSEVVLPKI